MIINESEKNLCRPTINKIVIKSGNNKKSIKNYIDVILQNLFTYDEILLVGIGRKYLIFRK